MTNTQSFFDTGYPLQEQFPRQFTVKFDETESSKNAKVTISVNGNRIGDTITDNSYKDDAYRFHDVFHLSYVAILGWSPCIRNMLHIKRKSDDRIDEVEDGARAIITEEAISLLVFGYARKQKLFSDANRVDPQLLKTIETLVSDFEVSNRSLIEWEKAILDGYDVFRKLKENRGGVVHVDMLERKISFTNH